MPSVVMVAMASVMVGADLVFMEMSPIRDLPFMLLVPGKGTMGDGMSDESQGWLIDHWNPRTRVFRAALSVSVIWIIATATLGFGTRFFEREIYSNSNAKAEAACLKRL
jgi:hypothetical protein